MLAMYQRDPSQPIYLLQRDFSQPMYLMHWNPSQPNPSPLMHLSHSVCLPITMIAFDNGFTLGSQRTETVKGVPHKIWRNCVCGGTYEPQDGGIALRNLRSNKCECEYVAIMKGAVKKGVVGQWTIRVPDQKGTHTGHPPLTREGLRAFPQARRLTQTPEVRTEIQNMVKAHTKPRQILATINKHKDKPLRFGGVLIMYCTYRTNKHKMPLLHVVGITDTAHSFSGAFMLMARDTTEDYEIALDLLTLSLDKIPHVVVIDCDTAFIGAIKCTWPQTIIILCRWNLFQNIKKHCQKNFVDEDTGKHDAKDWADFNTTWHEIEQAPTLEEFQKLWKELEGKVDEATYAYLEKK
ncbi:hypothetical protein PsorP6_008274 [Peronosclerospora sorghi]|uniref:Uncharacterized protein n=1 Tax=Peronosclerospora sorghi TaxID=230839 RepID=A0ACC0W7G5_9STRA|nr:hypothetical protein PsorP6_008274 [Peronosclerospora sorghi]